MTKDVADIHEGGYQGVTDPRVVCREIPIVIYANVGLVWLQCLEVVTNHIVCKVVLHDLLVTRPNSLVQYSQLLP